MRICHSSMMSRHNVAKIEEHTLDGKVSNVCVHRKGATRAFGPGSRRSSSRPYFDRATGNHTRKYGDILICVMRNAGCHGQDIRSTCHGAGRVMSRTQAKKDLNGRQIAANLLKEGIIVRAHSENAIADEAPVCTSPAKKSLTGCP